MKYDTIYTTVKCEYIFYCDFDEFLLHINRECIASILLQVNIQFIFIKESEPHTEKNNLKVWNKIEC